MISYYDGGIKKTYDDTPLPTRILKSLILANPYKPIDELRGMQYGLPEYKKFKTDTPFPCCKPHSTFKLVNHKAVLQKLSGLIYFDVDNSKIPEEYKIMRW